jgi:hypothetical protein
VFVGGLSESVTDDAVRMAMSGFGPITALKVLRQPPQKGQSRTYVDNVFFFCFFVPVFVDAHVGCRFAFVTFENLDSAMRAVSGQYVQIAGMRAVLRYRVASSTAPAASGTGSSAAAATAAAAAMLDTSAPNQTREPVSGVVPLSRLNPASSQSLRDTVPVVRAHGWRWSGDPRV